MTTEKTLTTWKDEFARLDRCPWPGPRPLQGSDGIHLLLGRDADRDRFLAEVDRFRLVLLTGSSGVGKTSLIEVGLVPELRDKDKGGYTVALCRDWSGGADGVDPVAFLAGKVAQALADGGHEVELPEGAGLFWELEKQLPGRVVLVLDQFEELIRDAADLTDRLFPLLVELNQRTSIHLVISFRSEYMNELRPLESKAKPFTISHIQLEPVASTYGRAIIEAANRGDDPAISDSAAKRIARQWTDAFGQQTGQGRSDRFGRVGILHLQALLYALHGRAGGATIDATMVDTFDDGSVVGLFSRGMRESIALKLDRCREAAGSIGVDPYLVEGTASFVARSVEHLSSVGYKLVRGVYDLWTSSLGGQLEVLPSDHEGLLHAVTSTILLDQADSRLDLLQTRRVDFSAVAAGNPIRQEEFHDGPTGDVDLSDPREVTCGPMMGLPPEAILIEELRRYAFALAWLQASSLIRISTPGRQGAMISLIHDGFGAALERWSEEARKDPLIALRAITAPRGAEFIWQIDGSDEPDHPDLDGLKDGSVLANLRWKGAWIRATFRQVQFVNCDLRGAGFDRCTFTGVSFVNCLLDGAMFTNCLVIGSPRPAEGGYEEDPPEYLVTAPSSILDAFATYRGGPPGDHLLSPLPGLPAHPVISATSTATLLEPEVGGLTFYGGRVSSLVLRSNRFAHGGKISFRQIAGSGLEIVEQSSGAFELSGSRLRHVVFTPPMHAETSESRGLDLAFAGSVLAQVWLSDALTGQLRADDCTLVQVWNGSSVEAIAESCAHFDLVNVALGANCAPVDPLGEPAPLSVADPSGRIRSLARGMDYRRDAAAVAREGRGEV